MALSSRAMIESDGVPQSIDYRRYAIGQRSIEGGVPLVTMPRIVAAAHERPDDDTVAQLTLGFREDDQRRVHAEGRVRTQIVLQCQRCGRAYAHLIDTGIAGVIATDDAAAAAVPHADEPIMADGDRLDIGRLLEEELLLALPMVARCHDPACEARYNTGSSIATSGDLPEPRDKTGNPFDVLKNLKHDDSN